jgi:HD-GYP domain-containing protein (c-di-GMP phosphodiesterase class II)
MNMTKIWDQPLKASKVISPWREEDEGFVPLPLCRLPSDGEVPFEVYIKIKVKKDSEPEFVHCCGREQVFPRHWREKLMALQIPWVYFPVGDHDQVLQYLNRRMECSLADENLDNREKIRLIYDVSLIWLRDLFMAEEERIGQRLGLALRYVDGMWEAVTREQSQGSFVLELWRLNQGIYTHSLNLCLLGLAFVSYLGWTGEEAQAFGQGALLHDIGMTQVPRAILNKKDHLTADDREVIKKHTFYGFRLLKNFASLRREILLMTLQHHENGDGSGYPDGLRLAAIHPWARILRILDSYEAMTAARPWREALAPKEALWTMRSEWEKSNSYDPRYMASFIKFLAGI